MNLINSVPNYPSFRRVKLADKSLISEFLNPYPPFSELIFSNLYDWRYNGLYSKISILNGNLLIISCDVSSGKNAIWLVGSSQPKDTLSILLSKFKKVHIPFYLYDAYKNIYGIDIDEDPSNHEYIYDVSEVISMKGNRREKFRRNVNKFIEVASDYELRIMTNPKNKKELYKKIEELFRSWSRYKSNGKADEYNTFFEFDSLKQYLIHSNLYNLTFMGLYKGDELCAFSTIEINKNKNVAYVCYAKSTLLQRGMSEYIFYKTAEFVNSKEVKYINFEQDLGILNLRRYKEKLAPTEIYKSYIIKSKTSFEK